MNICVIIAGGDVTGAVQIPEGSLVICADSGLYHAKRLGITPDVIIGDFDSYTDAVPEDIPVLRLPVEKDVTDTMRAVQYGEEHGCGKFHIYGALGGARIDHSLATLQMLRYLYEHGKHAVLCHGNTLISMQYGDGSPHRYPRFAGDFSLFAMTEVCEGVTIRGTKYDVEHITLRNNFPLGVSNTITAGFAEVTVQSGLLLVVQVRQ
ncbi:MAG: thiamine diphosphokinase [Oscillospiraceae bacterium]|nr:thiamine diphosphokinase [Oscillospiraceae bacterium]